MIQAPQSTSRVVMLKAYLSGTAAPATGKTVAVVLSKNGAAFANPSAGATNATELSNGWYSVTLSITDTNTLGDLIVRGTAAGCDDSERLFGVVKATNAGQTALPDTAVDQNASLITLASVVPVNPVANTVGESLFFADILGGRIGTALAGATSTITLDAGASSTDGRYVGYMVYLYGGTGGGVRGVGQERTITAYNGTTKVATVAQPWGTVPDNTSKFALVVVPNAAPVADKILGRSLAGGTDGGRTVQDSLRAARNKVAFDVPSTGQFTVYAEDDTTPAWTGTYTRGGSSVGALTTIDPG